LEIVIERSRATTIEEVLRLAGAMGFTTIYNAGGGGDRGFRRADDVTDTDENCIFIVALEDDAVLARVIEDVRPLLKRYGGICLMSEAQWVGV
jgi:nitrogen regulatory protein PII